MKLKGLGGMLVRYVGAAVLVGLCLFFLNVIAFVQFVISCNRPDNVAEYRISTISNGVKPGNNGFFSVSPEARKALNERYEWAMLLDNEGNVIWEDRMPEELSRKYSVPEVAAFARWYLEDFPVYCWRNNYGLMVVACAPGSEWKYDITMKMHTMEAAKNQLPAVVIANILTALIMALFLGWRMYLAFAPAAEGIRELANCETVKLPEKGPLKLILADINRASEELVRQKYALQKRDRTRTEWIAGVSHDIRTPLALVQGSAAQLENDIRLPQNAKQKAKLIRSQSQRIGKLVSDLNLASKLEYGLQPLNISEFRPASTLRAAAAELLNQYETDRVYLEALIPDEADVFKAAGDEALIRRAIDNLLINSVSHNNGNIKISVALKVKPGFWSIRVKDNGSGLPEDRINMLKRESTGTLPSHGLGLVLVKQIAGAHNGTASFENMTQGLCVTLCFPL